MGDAGEWLLYQLCDSAFPTGGFAHSAGLEAAYQLGEIVDRPSLVAFLDQSLAQAARSAGPFVVGCCRAPDDFQRLDALLDVCLSNALSNKASRSQGNALAATASRAFASVPIAELSRQIRNVAAPLPGHFPTVFGTICGLLNVTDRQAVAAYLFQSMRSLLSASVRLGVVGPLEAQAIQFEQNAKCERHIEIALKLTPEAAHQSSPLLDLIQGQHERLYSRLFVS